MRVNFCVKDDDDEATQLITYPKIWQKIRLISLLMKTSYPFSKCELIQKGEREKKY